MMRVIFRASYSFQWATSRTGWHELPTDQTVVLTCRSGNRSGQVTTFLQENGFENVHNMEGGILAWEDAGFAVER